MDISPESDAMIIRALRRKGYKATPQRIAICRFVLNSQDHPAAQRIYSEVKKIYPTVGLATIYKTLQILKELGLIQEVSFPQGQARFDPNMDSHINLVCLRCGFIRDLDDPTLRETVEKVAAEAKFTATVQSLNIYGICQKCNKSP